MVQNDVDLPYAPPFWMSFRGYELTNVGRPGHATVYTFPGDQVQFGYCSAVFDHDMGSASGGGPGPAGFVSVPAPNP